MEELHYLVLGQFAVSTLMGLGALCLFLWATASGLLRDASGACRRNPTGSCFVRRSQ